MLSVVSPAKSLDYDSPLPIQTFTQPSLLKESRKLARSLKDCSPTDLSQLMSISEKLGELNFSRYQEWKTPFSPKNARQAVLAFKGDVYLGLDAYDFAEPDFDFAQAHLRILSGLYGILRPLDLIQPYRLEMGTRFANERGKNLYEFWGSQISRELNKQLNAIDSDILLNLASNEYFKSVDQSALAAQIITPVFKEWKGDKYKIISFFAKRARGRMSAYIIKNKITEPAELKGFDWDGYRYDSSLSSASEWVFTRMQSE